nr:galactokinase family protein [Actinomadura sp. CNU-125]
MTALPQAASPAAVFEAAFGRAPDGVWRAPGRVNLIGEHTDYNDGFVLPFALAQGVSVAAARRDDGIVEVRSVQASAAEPVRAPVAGGPVVAEGWPPGRAWAAYPVGVARVLHAALGTGGASLLVDADLPQGAGLSSSAALECATALALCDLHGVDATGASWPRWRSGRRTSRSAPRAGSWTSRRRCCARPGTRCCWTAAAACPGRSRSPPATRA